MTPPALLVRRAALRYWHAVAVALILSAGLAGGVQGAAPLPYAATEPLSWEQLRAWQAEAISGAQVSLTPVGSGWLLYDLAALLPTQVGQPAQTLQPQANGHLLPTAAQLRFRRSASTLVFLPMSGDAAVLSGLSIDLHSGRLRLAHGGPSIPAQRLEGGGYRWDFTFHHWQDGTEGGGQQPKPYAMRGQLLLHRLPSGATLLAYHNTQMEGSNLRSQSVLLRY